MISNNIKNTNEYKQLLAATKNKSNVVALFGLPPSARAQIISALCEDTNRKALIICDSEAEATRFSLNLNSFGSKSEVFPARDFLFRSAEGQNREYETRRLSVMGNIVGERTDIVCAPIEAVLQCTMPHDEFCKNTITLKKGSKISIKELSTKLLQAGYFRRAQVDGIAQFSTRGDIVDIFTPEMQNPCRISFWGDVIESIHNFDLVSQRRDAVIKKIHLSPAREVLFAETENALKILNNALNSAKDKSRLKKVMQNDIRSLENDIMPSCMDKYLNIRYEKEGHIIEYLNSPIIFLNEPSAIRDSQTAFLFRFGQEIENYYEHDDLCADLGDFYKQMPWLHTQLSKTGGIVCENFTRSINDIKLDLTVNMPSHALPPWSGELSSLLEEITPLIAQKYSIAILAGTKRAVNALVGDLQGAHINAIAVENSKQQLEIAPGGVAVLEGHLTAGAEYPFAKFAVFTGRRHSSKNSKKPVKAKRKGLSALTDISPGDYVVHQNHGIGLYVGIQRLDLHGVVKDYLKISYSKGDTLYVPVTQLDIVSRYTAPGDSEKVKLAKLGTDAWTKTKNRVRAATKEMARELILLYAKRKKAEGYAFPKDGEWQRDFEARFAYDETNDQLTSTHEIKKDMERATPMDRLLCGDVGVGKTEVALRAAFKCVMGGKQCAILVPTTILAWQHYNSLINRMQAFPVKIGLLSRFRTAAQQRETIRGLLHGTVDIVVGTHRLIQKDIKFNDLGLVIIDEEQRFGVKHKERLKEAFVGVDMLTLSATPIPRTLNMALSGLRDMSTIDEPPIERQPVETYVMEYDDVIISAALKKELGRGGQVYYLHNRVETIDACAMHVSALAPEARIATAHGKMDEATLSKVWQQLMDGDIDVLICTTLIETGVDVRNCNTLIIEDSDRMGLAQLYQLRGRVGRSGRKAYAYFTFRRDKVLTDIAAKRLSAIREFTSFGSGFRIAMRDLQIRGAGNLLGQSQHGHMESVGYDMYVKMLNQAIAYEKGEAPKADKSECLIDISVDAYIPEKYIEDTGARIEIYKLIAAIQTKEDAKEVKEELNDRFGKPPESALGLIEISLARVIGSKLNMYEITQKKDVILFYSDALNEQMARGILVGTRNSKRRILVNASAKPYVSAQILQGEKPLDAMLSMLTELYDFLLQSDEENKA